MLYNVFVARLGMGVLLFCYVGPFKAQTANQEKFADRMPAFRLEATKSVTFKAEVSYNHEEGNETKFVLGQDFVVQAKRPGLLHIQNVTERSKFNRPGGIQIVPFCDFVSNGKNQLEIASASHVYQQHPAAATLNKVLGSEGLPFLLNINLMFATHVIHDFHLKYVDRVVINGTETAEFKSPIAQLEGGQYVSYIAVQTGLPLRVSILESDDRGKLFETTRTDYSDWKLDVDLPAATFDTTPAPGFLPDTPEAPKYDVKWKRDVVPAPINAKTLNGDTVTLDKYKGQVVLLDYWASWCGPCVEEMPSNLTAYQRFHKQGLEIVGVSLDTPDQRGRMDKYLSQHPLPWPQVCDGGGFKSPLAKAYAVSAIPFNLLIGRDGKIAAIDVHGKALEDAIVRALNTK